MNEQDCLSCIGEYLDGALSDEERQVFEARMAEDEELRSAVEAERKLLALLASAPRPAAPAGFRQQVMERIGAGRGARILEAPGRGARRRFASSLPGLYRWAQLAAAAVVLLVGIRIFRAIEWPKGGAEKAQEIDRGAARIEHYTLSEQEAGKLTPTLSPSLDALKADIAKIKLEASPASPSETSKVTEKPSGAASKLSLRDETKDQEAEKGGTKPRQMERAAAAPTPRPAATKGAEARKAESVAPAEMAGGAAMMASPTAVPTPQPTGAETERRAGERASPVAVSESKEATQPPTLAPIGAKSSFGSPYATVEPLRASMAASPAPKPEALNRLPKPTVESGSKAMGLTGSVAPAARPAGPETVAEQEAGAAGRLTAPSKKPAKQGSGGIVNAIRVLPKPAAGQETALAEKAAPAAAENRRIARGAPAGEEPMRGETAPAGDRAFRTRLLPEERVAPTPGAPLPFPMGAPAAALRSPTVPPAPGLTPSVGVERRETPRAARGELRAAAPESASQPPRERSAREFHAPPLRLGRGASGEPLGFGPFEDQARLETAQGPAVATEAPGGPSEKAARRTSPPHARSAADVGVDSQGKIYSPPPAPRATASPAPRAPGSGPAVAVVVYRRQAESEADALQRGVRDLGKALQSAGGSVRSSKTTVQEGGRPLGVIQAALPPDATESLVDTFSSLGYRYERALNGQSLDQALKGSRLSRPESAMADKAAAERASAGAVFFEQMGSEALRTEAPRGAARRKSDTMGGRLGLFGDMERPSGRAEGATPGAGAGPPAQVDLSVRVVAIPPR